MATLAQIAAAGEIYRKRHCEKCGAEFEQKLIAYVAPDYEGSQWLESNAFEPAPLGKVIVNHIGFTTAFGYHRFEMLLCQNCAMEIFAFLDDYKKEGE